MRRLDGKIIVVTGAASGIGRGIAHVFAAEGGHVHVTDVDGDGAERVAGEIASNGGQATPFTVDVSRGQDVQALFRAVESAHGRADVIVNNAGLNVRADFRHLADAEWERIREVNLDGVVRIARDGFGLLKAAGSGSLINIASIMGHRGMRQLAAYSASKGAVAALTRALAVEYAPFGIRVNALAPGFIETSLTERVLRNPMVNKALIDRTPMRRFGTSEEVAKAALFFASDDSAFVTGAELAVDGGMSASL
ncbi:Short-chain dehydrogenase [Candidatus Filomicrobium marinum]|uniref:Short-chain dehydrogenase n=1 Tax=Candidatus Filomicrobium marinum TaxID=1608628 RepID=A0A0D6JIT2_9HYPH|nr:SDR family NAD(P)-dependent oxidoreductase [Candidatus Filomicrobium marinum]CFX34186.1 Short-chain dehydrogenase [Candidatus Filomicrobium marinum]CPR21873.1 Short-chain dehydrogenase [Candidatus Filomicrobium marinum]